MDWFLQVCLREIQATDNLSTTTRPTFQDHSGSAVTALKHIHDLYFLQPTQSEHDNQDTEQIQRVADQQAATPPPSPQRVEDSSAPPAAPLDTRPIISRMPTPFADRPNTFPKPNSHTTSPTAPPRRSARLEGRPAFVNLATSAPPGSRSNQRFETLHEYHPELSASLALHTVSNIPQEARLNLDDFNRPLTFKRAMEDSHREAFLIADIAEFSKYFDTECIRPIHPHEQPIDRRGDTTYYSKQVKEKYTDLNEYQARVRGVAGGDLITYLGDVSAQVAAMSTVKILLNSIVSDNANMLTIDIKDFYLGTPMDRPEYMRMPANSIPDSVQEKYKLMQYINHKGNILFEINKTLWGLPQSGLLSRERLCTHLASHGYLECARTPGLFRHRERNIAFTLVVDDFLIKFKKTEDATHLVAALSEKYALKVNWEATKYLGYTIKHNKEKRILTLAMPTYIAKALERYCPNGPPPPQSSPAAYRDPVYGQKGPQMDSPSDPSDDIPLGPDNIKYIQQVTGTLLYYAIAQDATILPAVTFVASEQSKATQSVLDALNHLLGYVACHAKNQLVFRASHMKLHIQSDGSHLSRSGSRSVAGAFYYLGDTNDPTLLNGPIDVVSSLIPVITASAAETEYASVFLAAQRGTSVRQTLIDLGYPQHSTIILCDNSCAVGLANNNVKAKRSKAIDMRFHWIQDRVKQGQFQVIWRAGQYNLADFFTKTLPVKEFRRLRHFFAQLPASHASSSPIGTAKRLARNASSRTWRRKDSAHAL